MVEVQGFGNLGCEQHRQGLRCCCFNMNCWGDRPSGAMDEDAESCMAWRCVRWFLRYCNVEVAHESWLRMFICCRLQQSRCCVDCSSVRVLFLVPFDFRPGRYVYLQNSPIPPIEAMVIACLPNVPQCDNDLLNEYCSCIVIKNSLNSLRSLWEIIRLYRCGEGEPHSPSKRAFKE